jgi:hypothetical protein
VLQGDSINDEFSAAWENSTVGCMGGSTLGCTGDSTLGCTGEFDP